MATRSKKRTKKGTKKIKKIKLSNNRKIYAIIAVLIGLVAAGLILNARAGTVHLWSNVSVGNTCEGQGGTLYTETNRSKGKGNARACELKAGNTYFPDNYKDSHKTSTIRNFATAKSYLASKGYNTVKTCFYMRAADGTTAVVDLDGFGDPATANHNNISVQSDKYREFCYTNKFNNNSADQNAGIAAVKSGKLRIVNIFLEGSVKSVKNAQSGSYGTWTRPFSESSVYNTPLNDNLNYEGGTTAFQQASTCEGGRPCSYIVQDPVVWGIVFWRGTSNDPTYDVNIYSWGLEDFAVNNGQRQTGTWKVRIPDGAWGSAENDGHFGVYDETTGYVWDLYQASVNRGGKTVTAPGGARQKITGDGMRGGVKANGHSGLAGLIKKSELEAGVINHRLHMMLPQDVLYRNNAGQNNYKWPAIRGDDQPNVIYQSTQSWAASMGDTYALPRSVNINSLGLSRNGVILAKALQEYGGTISDQAGARSIASTNQDAKWPEMNNDAAILGPLLRRVPSVTQANPGG